MYTYSDGWSAKYIERPGGDLVQSYINPDYSKGANKRDLVQNEVTKVRLIRLFY